MPPSPGGSVTATYRPLDPRTKGRRDRRFPWPADVDPFRNLPRGGKDCGLLLERRTVVSGQETAPLRELSVGQLSGEYRARCDRAGAATAAGRTQVRDAVLWDAGA